VLKPHKLNAARPVPIHPFFAKHSNANMTVDKLSTSLADLSVKEPPRGKLFRMSAVPSPPRASLHDNMSTTDETGKLFGIGRLPPTSPGRLSKIIPRPTCAPQGLRAYSTTAGTFRPGPTTPPRVSDLAARRVTTAAAPLKTRVVPGRVRGEEAPVDDTEDVEDAQSVSSLKAPEAEPLVLHPGNPRVSYDPSLATADPVTEPHELSASLPFFSYRDPLHRGRIALPNVVYTSSAEEADDLVACLRGDVLGLDLEWPPPGQGPVRVKVGRNREQVVSRDPVWVGGKPTWPQGRTSVIQLYDGHMAIIFHLMGKTSPGPGLVRLLADRTRLKVGVAVRGDALKLVRDFPACAVSPPAGILELTHVARAIEPQRWKTRAALVALAKLCQGYLGLDIDKSQVRYGAWNERLNQQQIDCESCAVLGADCRRGQ